ncbi:MAG TPA: cysteine--tRNA ligase, partial [Alphaproteobacteria bacterium]|nr:cysteine--tRNA ligase [Alphaproteobacteria bacterium]
ADARQRVLTQNNISADEIQAKIDARAAAKAARDYATADAIRGELMARGIALMDSPNGTTWDIAM